jgi:hypothetical protein
MLNFFKLAPHPPTTLLLVLDPKQHNASSWGCRHSDSLVLLHAEAGAGRRAAERAGLAHAGAGLQR